MNKFDEALVRIAYVAKLLIGATGMAATGLLGVSGLPASWKVPLMAAAAVGSAVALYKVPNGAHPDLVKMWHQFDQMMAAGDLAVPAPTTEPEAPADPPADFGPDSEGPAEPEGA